MRAVETLYSNIVGIYIMHSLQFMMETCYLWNHQKIEFQGAELQDSTAHSEIGVA